MISYYNESIYEKLICDVNERYQALEELTTICSQIEDVIKATLDKQLNLEQQISNISKQIEDLMKTSQINSENSQKERESLEKEEKIIYAQQKQAEQLRKESEETLSHTKTILMQTTQELRQLSNRDISIIKSMNHPPRGVFLVVKSIVLIMGYKIEDKNDEPDASQPSWILGKKLLSDPSFVQVLMKQALENINEETLNSLQIYIDDPLFHPSIVANSSTAAKSICQFVHAIVPYYSAMKIFHEKQNELQACEEHLKALQKRHDIANYRLTNAVKEYEDSEAKSKNLLLNKERIEIQIQDQKGKIEQYQNAMKTMEYFFETWRREFIDLRSKKDFLELRSYFIAICLALYSIFDISERDKLFEIVKNLFNNDLKHYPSLSQLFPNSLDNLFGFENRIDILNEIQNFLLFNENDYGIKISTHLIENIALFMMTKRNWFLVKDPDNTFTTYLRPIITNKFIITSFISSEFLNDLSNALLGNDILIIYDYNWELSHPLLNEIFENRGQSIEISILEKLNSTKTINKKFDVPFDFKVVFIVDSFPDSPIFDSVLIDNALNEHDISEEISYKLFTAFCPEENHETINIVKTLKDANNELKRINNDLENEILTNVEKCLYDEKILKHFQNSTNLRNRILVQIKKLQERKSNYMLNFEKIQKNSDVFVDLYHESNISGGIMHFYDILINELSIPKLNKIQKQLSQSSNHSIDEKFQFVFNSVRVNVYTLNAIAMPFDSRIKYLCNKLLIKPGEYYQTIQEISSKLSPSSLCFPTDITSLFVITCSRRAIITSCNYQLVKYLLLNDKTIISSVFNLNDNFTNALNNGKMLAVIINDVYSFPLILPIISKIRNSNTLSNDFRFFILMDYCDEIQNINTSFLHYFCDVIDFNTIPNIKCRMSLSLSSLPLQAYDSPIPNKASYWRRLLLLLSFFDSSANLLIQMVFQNQKFNEENFNLMIEYLSTIENPVFENIGQFFISTFYAVEQPQIGNNLLNLWNNIFNQHNFNSNSLFHFDSYQLPINYSPSKIVKILKDFPLIDNPMLFELGPDPTAHFRAFKEAKWKASKLSKMDFTSIDLRPFDLSEVVWYMKFEAKEVNKRFLHQQHLFSRSLRRLLQCLRSENPIVDLSIMFRPSLFFANLKHHYIMNQIFNLGKDSAIAQTLSRSEKSISENIIFILSNEKSEIEIENLIIINSDYDTKDSLFIVSPGSRVLPNLYIQTKTLNEFYDSQQNNTDRKIIQVPLYHHGKNICSLYMIAAIDLNPESVLMLTAFTDMSKLL